MNSVLNGSKGPTTKAREPAGGYLQAAREAGYFRWLTGLAPAHVSRVVGPFELLR